MCVLKLTLGKIIISANFPLLSTFQCEAFGRTCLTVWTHAVLSITSLASGPSGRIANTFGLDPHRFLFIYLLSLPYAHLYISWFILSCYVFFLRISIEVLAFFAHLFSLHGIFCVILCSFKVSVLFIIMEYLLIGIFFWDIVYENPFMSVCWVHIDVSGSFGLWYLLL
jgi:hypothetical protein